MVDMDLFEQCQIDELRREIQIMSLCRHENVLPVHRSFMHDSKLCIVTPVMTAGIVPKHCFNFFFLSFFFWWYITFPHSNLS